MGQFIIVLRDFVFGVLNLFIKKESKSIMFIPHENCKVDRYDIFSYTSDNVLMVLHQALFDERFSDYLFFIVYFEQKELSNYHKYIDDANISKRIKWVYRFSNEFYFSLLRCKICLTDHAHYDFQFKTNSQKFISLGYFTPFKDDFFVVKKKTKLYRSILSVKNNRSFDNYIVTSSIAGRIISIDSFLSFEKFLPLGHPRNDVFYEEYSSRRARLLNMLGFNTNTSIFCYTPTFRDYERKDLRQFDNTLAKEKTILGHLSKSQEEMVESTLNQCNSIILAKMHPWQQQDIIEKNKDKRIILFDEIQSLGFSLYDILAMSDCLITDYTSTAFDFLHSNKPIIYYFYDYDLYVKSRGFSFTPIESVCGGPIAYSCQDLIKEILDISSGHDVYSQKRDFVHSLINTYHDGSSTSRVLNFILSVNN